MVPRVLPITLALALTLAGCIAADAGQEDAEEPTPVPWFDAYSDCHATEDSEWDTDCDAAAQPATVLAELPAGAFCIADHGTHRVFADPVLGKVLLAFSQSATDADYVTGTYHHARKDYAAHQGRELYISEARFQWTAPGSHNVVALDLPVSSFLGADTHSVRFAGLDVEATGRAAAAGLSVQWLLLHDATFDPVYRFSSSEPDLMETGDRYFRGPTPLDITGGDFTLRIQHYDEVPPGTKATNRPDPC